MLRIQSVDEQLKKLKDRYEENIKQAKEGYEEEKKIMCKV